MDGQDNNTDKRRKDERAAYKSRISAELKILWAIHMVIK
jgi:hypothetical protein